MALAETFVDLDIDLDRDENLEEQMENQYERQDIVRFSNEVLFCIQGLGSIKPIETEQGIVESYVKVC